jgi:hypothetical protein
LGFRSAAVCGFGGARVEKAIESLIPEFCGQAGIVRVVKQKWGRAGEGWNPLQTGYLQYAVFARGRQEESESAARIPIDYAGTFTLPARFRENLASSVILAVVQQVSLRPTRLTPCE